ncbi:MAG: glycosyltransferase family 4 protein [candidate division WOR-3 bacterium]|nr:MAG: glycosyltransferase family 4 protein [candidate division WOR-3 bacterium]
MRIVNIRAQPPAYDLYWNDPRPRINWDISDGSWVGIWEYGWADLIGRQVLRYSDGFEYEVWQPDLRADKVYSYTFSGGLVHKAFPATLRRKKYGFKNIDFVSAKAIYDRLLSMRRDGEMLVHLNGINLGIGRDVLSLELGCPVVLEFLGEVKSPVHTFFQLKKNILSKIHDVSDYFALKYLFNKADAICCCNERSRQNLRRYFDKEISVVPVGLDCDYWQPRGDKALIREQIGLDHRPVLLTSSRLNGLKQIDKVIRVLRNLDSAYDFQYVVTGHGTEEYENYLRYVGESLMKKGKLKFVGYLRDEDLKMYYRAADLFIITSLSEGAPDAAKKALAMELPVFSTDTGYVAELLAKYGAGKVVPLRDYERWEQELRYFLEGRMIETMDIDLVRSYFHWPNVAKQYIDVYNRLFERYYG